MTLNLFKVEMIIFMKSHPVKKNKVDFINWLCPKVMGYKIGIKGAG